MSSVDTLTAWFRKFPGIGPRQARRFVYFLLSQKREDLQEFSNLIQKLKEEIAECTMCFRYFPKGAKATNICGTCSDLNRRSDILMIVPKDVDYEAIEKSGVFEGRYFILGGTLHLLDKDAAVSNLRFPQLKTRIENLKKEGLKEIIIATNLNPEGDHTSEAIVQSISPLLSGTTIKLSALGRGLSTGIELEYVDPETIKNALRNRLSS